MIESNGSRRRFLKVLAVGVGAGAIGCSGTPAPFGQVSAGNVSALPNDTLRTIGGVSAAIGRDNNGVYALSLVCTHEQCDISTDGTVSFAGIECSCHGSRFDANGNVIGGPANAPLPHYSVTIDSNGAITVDGGVTVSEATRVVPPMA